jgi:hypothetical protein
MNKTNQKLEKEKKDAKTTKAAKTSTELPEQELEKAAGGASTPGFLKATSRITD